jgi:hypothetical protein
MPIDKRLQKKWYVTKLKIGIPVPAVDEVLDGSLHAGVLCTGLRKYATPFPEIVHDQIYRRFVFFGDDGGHWRLTHDQILLLWRKRPGFLCRSRRRCPVADDA